MKYKQEQIIPDTPYGPIKFQNDSSPIYSEEIKSGTNYIKLDQKNILQGIIFSEILGKPKSLRRGRW